jgi:hypothetical protein
MTRAKKPERNVGSATLADREACITTLAFNLSDGTEAYFEGSPKEVVCAAFRMFTRRDRNTWTWRLDEFPTVSGRFSIACGDWCACTDRRKTPLDNSR